MAAAQTAIACAQNAGRGQQEALEALTAARRQQVAEVEAVQRAAAAEVEDLESLAAELRRQLQVCCSASTRRLSTCCERQDGRPVQHTRACPLHILAPFAAHNLPVASCILCPPVMHACTCGSRRTRCANSSVKVIYLHVQQREQSTVGLEGQVARLQHLLGQQEGRAQAALTEQRRHFEHAVAAAEREAAAALDQQQEAAAAAASHARAQMAQVSGGHLALPLP